MDVSQGWYPDPEDPANLRWWDGTAWTDHRHPVAGVAPTAPQADAPAEPIPDGSPAGVEPTVDQPAVEPTVVDQPAVEPLPAEPVPTEPTLVDGPVVDDPTAVFPAAAAPEPPPPPAPAPEGRGRSRTPVLIAVGIVALIAVAAGAFLFFSGDDDEYTWDGQAIVDLDETLSDADEAFLAGAQERNGATTDDSRCYVVQSAAADAERPSDLLDHLRCGPVLFVDDDPDDGVWLVYALSGDENDDGDVVLEAADLPESPVPSDYDPDVEKLSRPDGGSPPDGDGGIEAPEPPAAEAGLVLSGDAVLDDVEMESSSVRAVGLTKSIELTGWAEPSRFGSRDEARTPADGERFIAFDLRTGTGDSLFGSAADQAAASSASSATVSVDVDGDETLLVAGGDPDGSHRHLVSVPEDAEVVDLVLVDADVTQRVSLLTQEPGPENLRVLARSTRHAEVGVAQAFPVVIAHPDGAVQNDTFSVTIEGVELLYYVDDVPDVVPSGPDRAFLIIHHFLTSDATGITQEDDIGLEPGHLHLETTNGDVVEAMNLAPGDGDLLIAFEVAADFAEATLIVRGSAASGDITIDLGDPDFRIPLAIEVD